MRYYIYFMKKSNLTLFEALDEHLIFEPSLLDLHSNLKVW